MKNYYEILGISRNSSNKEIRNAYLKKVKENHPDTNELFNKDVAEVNEAYSVLKDTSKRMEYNIKLDFETNQVFNDSLAYYYPESLNKEMTSDKTYRRVMIFLWVVLGFVASMLIFTLYNFSSLEEAPAEESQPFKLSPEKNPGSQDVAPKEIYHIREI